jgi:hypothetical protein
VIRPVGINEEPIHISRLGARFDGIAP